MSHTPSPIAPQFLSQRLSQRLPQWLSKHPVYAAWLLLFIICASAVAWGFIRPVDAAKTALWGALIGALLHGVLSRWRRLGDTADIAEVPALHRAVWLGFASVFVLDIAVQGVLRGFFGANPSPSIIAESLANTNTAEAVDFFTSQWRVLCTALAYCALCMGCVWVYTRHALLPLRRSAAKVRPAWWWACAALLLALHFNPTLLRQQPLLRWPVVAYRHMQAQHDIADAQHARGQLQAQHRSWGIQPSTSTQPKTVVLVIGESANRNNWSWYGYPRATTAPLEQTLASSVGHTLRWTQATSGQAYTLPSLRLALTPLDANAQGTASDAWKTVPDVFLLAKAGGYHITWLSNQVAFEGWLSTLGKSADHHAFVNTGNWRDASSTDFDLLPHLNAALAKPAPSKELIVLHLLGQHFHYDLRCPKDSAAIAPHSPRPFAAVRDDAVMQAMRAAGRSAAIQQARNDYDDATYCGAVLLSKALQALQSQRSTDRALEFIYFSDHGQEVGHTENFAGHSERSPHGYSVPLLLWSNKVLMPKSAASRLPLPAPNSSRRVGDVVDDATPYSINHLDHLIQGALGVRSSWYKADLDPVQR